MAANHLFAPPQNESPEGAVGRSLGAGKARSRAQRRCGVTGRLCADSMGGTSTGGSACNRGTSDDRSQ